MVANINDTITYTISLNVTGGPVVNISVSDVLPTHLNLVGFGSVPAGGSTSWNLSTRTATWTFSSLAPGTYTITYQAQVDSAAQQGTVLTNNAQLTYNGLASPKVSSVNLSMAMTAPTLYPNPVKGTGPANLQVVFSQRQDFVTIKVFTTAFRKVYDDTVKSVPVGTFLYALDPDHFKGSAAANGLYYVVITTPSNKWVSKLLIFL
jgi:fimbrial isopeptide formation D2 family protein